MFPHSPLALEIESREHVFRALPARPVLSQRSPGISGVCRDIVETEIQG